MLILQSTAPLDPNTVHELRRLLPGKPPGRKQAVMLRRCWYRANSDGAGTNHGHGWCFTLCMN